MADEIMIQPDAQGAPPVRVLIRRSARARRLSLRVSALDGRATLSLPLGTPLHVAQAFLSDKAAWLQRHAGQVAAPLVPEPGLVFPFRGRELRLESAPGRVMQASDDRLLVPGPPAKMPARLAGHLKQAARVHLVEASDRYAAALGRGYARITLRDTRSRWGSCTEAGNLMYSWRLVMAPVQVLEYVAAHEVAHLAEMNHSPAFWEVVARLYPGFDAPRAWLKREGVALHRWRFTSDPGAS